MKSIHLLLLLGTLCVFIVPSFQYGTIFTDYLSTPVNFTDITETYISGIKSKTAYANTASVETITATNPDGFYINSPGPLNAQAGQDLDLTSAQAVVFGTSSTSSTSLTSGGSLNIQSDRTDVDVDDLTLSTGNTLSFASDGPLNIQGNDVIINTAGNGFVSARDVTVDSATFTEIKADANILLNSTYHSSFISQNGDISITSADVSVFNANFINVDATSGVDIHSNDDVTIDAFAILEMQAAQFAQVRSQGSFIINVPFGDFDINAAATVAIAAEDEIDIEAAEEFSIYSFGDSESVIQFNGLDTGVGLYASNTLAIGTFVDSYDVDIISAQGIQSSTDSVTFVADNYISSIAGEDLSVIVSFAVQINSLDLDATSYEDSEIKSLLGPVTIHAVENFAAQAKDVYIATTNTIQINTREASFIQSSPAILSRSEPSNLQVITESISTSSTTTQFDTIGDLILSTPQLSIDAITVDIRSSAGPHDVYFNVGGTFQVIAADDIEYRSSNIDIEPSSGYLTTSATLNFVSEDSADNYFISNFDSSITSPDVTLSSADDTTINAPTSETNIIMTDTFTQNSYNNYLQTFGDINVLSGDTITIGGNEYLNFESVADSTFNANAMFVKADQTGSMFADVISGQAPFTNFYAGDTLYFTANLPTDSMDINAANITFVGETVIESGRNLAISASDEADFTGSSLLMKGYDYVNFDSTNLYVFANSRVSISSDGSFDLHTADLELVQDLVTAFIGKQDDSTAYLNANGYIHTYGSNSAEHAGGSITNTAGTISIHSNGNSDISANSASYESEQTITLSAVNSENSNAQYITYDSLINNLKTTVGDLIITATNDDVFASEINTLSSTGAFSSLSDDAWFLGGDLNLNGNTLTFIAGADGYFYSDDQITFDVTNAISVSSNTLNFFLPLDGTLFMEGKTTLIGGTGTTPFNFISYGATTLNSDGTLQYTSQSSTVFDSATTLIGTGSLTLVGTPALSKITFFAHEGEVDFSMSSSYHLGGASSAFLASRDVNIKGSTTFTSSQSDTVNVVQNTFIKQSVLDKLAILGETIHQDGNVVFDSLAGKIQNDAAFIYINTDGTQSITGAFGFTSSSGTDTTFTVTGNHNLQTATGSHFVAGNDWTLTVVGQTYIESGQDIVLQNTLTNTLAVPTPVFTINADRMTVTTSQDGPLHLESDSALLFLTTDFQSWEMTHSVVTQSGTSLYTSTVGDIVTLTSAGDIFSQFTSFSGQASVNITFNSGHDSTFSAGKTTYTAGTDILTHSLDGKIVFTNGAAATFQAGGQVVIDSEGVRTVPRDGVYFGADVATLQTTGSNSAIYLYAKRAVTFGEFTRPDVRFYGGGSPTQNGWVLTSDGKVVLDAGTETNFNSQAQFTLTTSQASIFTSGGAFNIESTGTLVGTADNVQISSLIGNIHFHSALDSAWYTPSQFSATSTTGYVLFTTLNQAVFEADGNFKLTSNSLTYSFDSSYTSTSSSTSFDGHTKLDISTQLGSDGSINIASGNAAFAAGGNFNINTYGDDSKLQLTADGALSIRTPKTGTISFSSEQDQLLLSSTNLFESSNKKFSITSNSNIGDDPSSGKIEFYTLGNTALSAQDTISLTASIDVSIIAGDLSLSTTGEFLASSEWDQEWLIGSSGAQSFTSLFDVLGTIYFRNSPDTGGDINFETAGEYDLTYFHSNNGDIIANIGANQIGTVTEGFRIATSGSDFKDAFGIRFQTEGAADLEVYASASASFSALKNVRFDASEDLDVYGGIGVSMVAQGVNLDNQGVLFVASKGDINFKTEQSPINFVGNHIDVVGNGTAADQGIIKLIANGISKDSEYGIKMQFDSAVAAFGSIAGDVSVTALESIEIGLNFQGAHALFGYQRNAYETLFSVFPYLPFYPYIPSNHIHTPLQSETIVHATGIGADIVFDTQKTEDGVGEFIAYAGTIEEVYFSNTNSPSQLQLLAYGNGDVLGDITFRQEGGMSFKGVDLTRNPTFSLTDPPLASNILFLANDESSDIEIKTTKEATYSDINFVTTELTINAENKLQIRSIGRDGDSVVQFDSARRISVSTTGLSKGPGTDLPGIELRAYRSIIQIDAGDYGDVIHHALRDMTVEADNGFVFSSRQAINFNTNSMITKSSSGGITYRFSNSIFNIGGDMIVDTFADNTSPDYVNYLGGDVTVDAQIIQVSTSSTANYDAVGGDIIFNFANQARIHPTARTFIYGYLSIPMTDELIIPGGSCPQPTAGTRQLVIARSPPYDAYNVFGITYADPQYAFYNADIYQGLGLRLCTCGNQSGSYLWSCMSFSQFTRIL